MGRSNAVILTTAILLAFAAGLLLGRGIDRGETELLDSAGNALVAPQARRAADRPRRAFQSVRAADAPRPAAEGTAGFAFERLRLETDGAAPQACLQFTEDLVTDGSIDYADYIRITPKTTPVVTVSGASACVLGLRFDQDYQIELRPGLPNADGDALERAERFAASFGDKPAYVGFAGDGVILPRLEADGVGLETVNVARLRVEIFRVSDRALARKRILSGGSTPENDYYYVYGEENGEDVGAPIFENVLAIDAGRNETKTTVFALGAALPALRPGAYFVRLKDVSPGADARRPAQAWRWVVFTDLALTSYSSAEGVDVVARSLQSGRSLGEVRLELVAQNNDILARAETSSDGLARFEKAAVAGEGPLAPKMIMAYGAEDDFAVLDLTRGPLDLSDYPIEGRGAPSLIDAYLYLDRGVYRPGETVHIAGLLRNAAGLAVERAASVVIRRPNGVEAFRQRIEAYESGGFAFDYEAPRAAPRGVWSIRIEADGAGLVGETTFSVEDFVPQRLAVTLEMDETTPMRAGERRPAPVESRYLYGAPAADLTVEGEARVRIDPNPFPTRSDYRFGLADERFTERLVEIDDGTTDAAGRATLTLDLGATPLAHTAPLRADFVVGVVEPGGRVVRESARIPVRPNDRYIGLRLTDDKGATARGGVGRGEAAIVEALALDRGGAPVAAELEWRLVEEDVWFDWYRQDGAWRWRRSSRDIPIAEGRATASAEAPAHIAQDLQPGDYRLTARDPATGATSDLRFYVGWRSQEAGAGRPDQAALTVDSNAVAPGGRARLMLDPPYAGEAVVVVATDRVHSVQRFKVEEDGQEIIIDTDPAWGAGFYVLASIVTPRSAAAQPTPRRAMGVAYVPFDVSARTLTLSLDAPAAARPRERLELPVRVDGVARNEEVMLTLAAVDEGILRLTKFASPDPTKYYFGKKRLGVAVRDDYGRILDANLAAPAAFGGDQIGGEGLTVVPQKSVALFSGPVRVDANGEARVAFDVPDFNGELRIMAVAWSAEKLGAASRPLTVRDPVPALLSLPRFLAPGDRAEATLLVDNVDGLAGPFEASLAATGPVAADETATLDLAPGEQARRPFRLAAAGAAEDAAPGAAPGAASGAASGAGGGVSTVRLDLANAGGFSVSHEYPIEVRSPYFPITTVTTREIAAGETLRLSSAVLQPFETESTEVAVSFSPLRGIDPAPLAASLSRYPYGCTEQLVSTAAPLLYAGALGDPAGPSAQSEQRAARARVQEAINTLLDRQGPDGAFGLWRVGDRAATGWLGAYTVDFLARAQEAGYAVPAHALESAYKALAAVARLDRWTYVSYRRDAFEGEWSNDSATLLRRRGAAYALYVLARAGRADASDLRYFHDALLKETPSPLARAHIGAGLAYLGDVARGVSAFRAAYAALGYDNTGDYYQTPLRDAAGALALWVEAGLPPAPAPDATLGAGGAADDTGADLLDREDFVERLTNLMRDPERLNTQEKSFALYAANALIADAGPVRVTAAGVGPSASGAVQFTPSAAEIAGGVEFRNDGAGPVYASVAVHGAPAAPPPPVSAGFTAAKRLLTRDGAPVDPAAIRQNDRLVIALTASPEDARAHPAVFADLLPAGFEIEAILRPEDGAAGAAARRRSGGAAAGGAYAWLGPISRPQIAEARDDRFVAALDIERRPATLAYLVRAVTPGDYAFPGLSVEDMYRPGVMARTETGRITIAPARD